MPLKHARQILVLRGGRGKLVGYIEFFGVLRFMVMLSRTHTGPVIDEAYGYSPVQGCTFHPEFGPLPEFTPNAALLEAELKVSFSRFQGYLDSKTTREVLQRAVRVAMGRLGEPSDELDVQDVIRETLNELEGTLLKRLPKHVLVEGSPPEFPMTKRDPCDCGSGQARRGCCYRTSLGPATTLSACVGISALGELRGLQWDDVDLMGARLHVGRAADDVGALGPSENGRARVVDLPRRAVEVLRTHRHLRGPFVFRRGTARCFSDGIASRSRGPSGTARR